MARISCGPLEADFEQKLLDDKDPGFRAWAIRAAGNAGKVDAAVRTKIVGLAKDEAPTVRLQTAIAARKIDGIDAIPTLLEVLNHSGDDKLIPHVVWQNLHPLLEDHADEFVRILEKTDLGRSPALAALMPRVVERILGRKQSDPALIAGLFGVLFDAKGLDPAVTRQCLEALTKKVQTGEIAGASAAALREKLAPTLQKAFADRPDGPLAVEAAALAATLKDPAGLTRMRQVADDDEAARGGSTQGAQRPGRGAGRGGPGRGGGHAVDRPRRTRNPSAAGCWTPWPGWKTRASPTSVLARLPEHGAGPAAAGHRTADAAHRLGETVAAGRRRQENPDERPQHQPRPQAAGEQGRRRASSRSRRPGARSARSATPSAKRSSRT